MKYCPKCKKEKRITGFNKSKGQKDGHYGLCRICQHIASEKYRSSQKGIDTIRKGHLRRTFGITPKDYNKLFNKQAGKCAICHSKDVSNSRAVHLTIDHNHKNGKIRGLLCVKCNSLLGLARDDKTILKNAMQYLILQT